MSLAETLAAQRTICDMTCFYEQGHDGPHQRWLGADCDMTDCHTAALYRWRRKVYCAAHMDDVEAIAAEMGDKEAKPLEKKR